MTTVPASLHHARLLVGGYLALSAATLAAVVAMSAGHVEVPDAVWVRTVIVVVTGALMFSFATRTLRGSRKAYVRWRVASAVMVVAIAVIVAIPGAFPVWLRAEQAACGLLLIAVVALISSRAARKAFPRD
ncbi:hypothetical protein GCM10027445_66850 [Amycolatopsis endophytica]|uniref:Integral membrane protein n=1 Tax=Amycolatopsis endophytica TaxID=860233 RepID=A0A853BCJ1_9PSEU|nr:hypothetical protein [Amycolatopsis endophytica]NYI92909.1 hypothetical protein [Amycolatopsis endophytica]